MCFGRITLLSVLGTQISQVHAKGFVEATHGRFFNHPQYQYIQINLQENLLKSFLVKLFFQFPPRQCPTRTPRHVLGIKPEPRVRSRPFGYDKQQGWVCLSH